MLYSRFNLLILLRLRRLCLLRLLPLLSLLCFLSLGHLSDRQPLNVRRIRNGGRCFGRSGNDNSSRR